jgi:hypothetical protein
MTFDYNQDLKVKNPPTKQEKQKLNKSISLFTQPVLSFGENEEENGEYGPWIITNKCDRDMLRLADCHYSRARKSIGSSQFTRPGKNLVLRTEIGDAGWVSWYSKKRDDHFKDVIECTFFRNESRYLSSDLVKWAVYASVQRWGIPSEGFITFVKDDAIQSTNPGSNYIHAGFKKVGRTKVRNLTILQLLPNQIEESLHDIRLIHQLFSVRQLIHVALTDGELEEAINIYRLAKTIEAGLREQKSDIARRKLHKWDSFVPNEEPMDFLHHMFTDNWIPEEMLCLFEDENNSEEW